MSNKENKIKRATGLLIIEVINSNPNGDPDRESDPRQRPDGRGEISAVSFKRKLRDLVEWKGDVWNELASSFQPKLSNDKFEILESRGRNRQEIAGLLTGDGSAFKQRYWDGRVFGNTFLESMKDEDAKKLGFKDKEISEFKANAIKTGVVQFVQGLSVAPVEIERQTNTNKSGVEEGKDRGMAPMAYRFIQHGVYCMPFFVNPSMANKSGCDALDIELMKKLIPHAYAHTRSHARPFVEIRHAWYCEHNNPLGSCSDFALIDALKPKKKGDANKASSSWDDYEVPKGLPEDLKNKVACVDLVNLA
ncbi:MAG: type I CRISPR-associated protein Cas7 [Pseudomonadota bacterium]